jgi:hypothetical protein
LAAYGKHNLKTPAAPGEVTIQAQQEMANRPS